MPVLRLSGELGRRNGLSYGEVHASMGSTICQHCGWGRSPWHRPWAAGMKAGNTLFPARPLHPCAAGILVFKAAVPGAKELGAPAIRSLTAATSLGRRCASSSRPPAPPCSVLPPPNASWPRLLRTPYLRVRPTAPRPRASLPPPWSLTGHGPTQTGWVGLAQPPGSHRELTAVSRILTPTVSTPGGQVG